METAVDEWNWMSADVKPLILLVVHLDAKSISYI